MGGDHAGEMMIIASDPFRVMDWGKRSKTPRRAEGVWGVVSWVQYHLAKSREWAIMSEKKTIDSATIEGVSQNLITVTYLLRKCIPYRGLTEKEHGINFSQAQILSMLSEPGSLSMSDISYRLGTAKPNVVPLVDDLIEDRLVARVRDTHDRRVVHIVLLDAGRVKLAAIRAGIGEQAQQWAGIVDAADMREMADSLARLNRLLSQPQKKA